MNDSRSSSHYGASAPRRAFRPTSASRAGQATIEYVIVLGFSALIGITFLSTFSAIVNNAILGFNAVLERELVPVGFPECGTTSGQSTWEN